VKDTEYKGTERGARRERSVENRESAEQEEVEQGIWGIFGCQTARRSDP